MVISLTRFVIIMGEVDAITLMYFKNINILIIKKINIEFHIPLLFTSLVLI
jgi:hypothetical protein